MAMARKTGFIRSVIPISRIDVTDGNIDVGANGVCPFPSVTPFLQNGSR